MNPNTGYRDPYYDHPRAYKDLDPDKLRLYRYTCRPLPLRCKTWWGAVLRALILWPIRGLFWATVAYHMVILARISFEAGYVHHFDHTDMAVNVYIMGFIAIFWHTIGWRLYLAWMDRNAAARARAEIDHRSGYSDYYAN